MILKTQRLQQEIRRATERCETVSKLHKKLYDDNVLGKLSDD